MAHQRELFRSDVPIKTQLLTIVEENPNLLEGFQKAAQEALHRGLIPPDDNFIKQLLDASRAHPELFRARSLPRKAPVIPIRCAIRTKRPEGIPGRRTKR